MNNGSNCLIFDDTIYQILIMKKLLLFLLLGFYCFSSFAQADSGELYYRVYFEAGPEKFSEINKLIVFEHLARNGKGYTGEFSESEKDILIANADQVKILISDMRSYYKKRAEDDSKKTKKKRNGGVPANFHGGSMGGFMTLDEAMQNLDSMVILFPGLVKPKQAIGTTLEGRSIYVYKISDNPVINETQEHKVLYTALHHAREPQSLAQLVYYMWYLLENYNTSDSVVKHLVDDRELFFIPVLNPDGYAYNELTDPAGGGMWRKNRQVNSGGSRGVDLNRNYGHQFGYDNTGSSPTGSSETFRGTNAFSEFETQAVRDLCTATKFMLIMNYHSYGNWLLYPWGYLNLTTPDNAVFNELASRFTVDNGFISGNCFQTLGYISNGSSDDWHYGEQTLKPKAFAFTPEVGSSTDGFWPIPSQIIPLSQENLTQNIMSSWMAGPYIEQSRLMPYEYSSAAVLMNYKFDNYGLDTCLTLKSWFTSSSPYFISSDTFNTVNLLSQNTLSGAIPLLVSSSTPTNTLISGRVYTQYNNFLFSDTSSFLMKAALATSAFSLDDVRILPNPTTGLFYIQSNTGFDHVIVEVKDFTGRILFRKDTITGNTFSLNISNHPKGIYTVVLIDGNKSATWKVVKD